MEIINIHDAKTRLSRLISRAVEGEPFIIAKAGRPLVRVSAIAPEQRSRRTGFLRDEIRVPDDFNTMADREIAELFGESDDTR